MTLNLWHATQVTGVITAEKNNAQGVAGISWRAKIMPLRVVNDKDSNTYYMAEAIRYVAGLESASRTVPARRADIIHISVGGDSAH